MSEPLEIPKGKQDLATFLADIDQHLDFGPLLVEVGSQFVASHYYLCRTKVEFEKAIAKLDKHDRIWVTECTEISPQCELTREEHG